MHKIIFLAYSDLKKYQNEKKLDFFKIKKKLDLTMTSLDPIKKMENINHYTEKSYLRKKTFFKIFLNSKDIKNSDYCIFSRLKTYFMILNEHPDVPRTNL